MKRGYIITAATVDGLQWPANYCCSLLDSPLPRQLPQVSRVSYFRLNAWSTATITEQMNARSRYSFQGFHTQAYVSSRVRQRPRTFGLGRHLYRVKHRWRLSTGNGDGGPVCDQPNQEWCIGMPNDRTCGSTKRIRIRIRIFMNEVRVLERKKNLKSLAISAYPIRRETCNPAGGGFCRIVEIRPDPDSRIGYPSIPKPDIAKSWAQFNFLVTLCSMSDLWMHFLKI